MTGPDSMMNLRKHTRAHLMTRPPTISAPQSVYGMTFRWHIFNCCKDCAAPTFVSPQFRQDEKSVDRFFESHGSSADRTDRLIS